jgi:putative tryptophan/tyrosine transport system substrate-binding protein
MMNRRTFLCGLTGILSVPLVAEAQPAGKVWRIGMLWFGSSLEDPPTRVRLDAFQQGLREQGYIEGRDVAFEHRYAQGKSELFPDLAAELVRLKVDVIVTPGNRPATLAAKQATSTIPIVFMNAFDPVAQGLAASLARPGGNITGLTSLVGPEIVGKQLELLKEAVPKLARVAVLRNPASASVLIREAEVAARSLKVQLQVVDARSLAEFEGAFAAMIKERVSAILVLADVVFLFNARRLAGLAAKHRLPAMYQLREHVETGGLMAYAANLAELSRRASIYVGKILHGAKPGDLPVEQPTKFDLVINLKTAKALGLTIPQSLLVRADELIH